MGVIQFPDGVVSLPVQPATTMKYEVKVSEGLNSVIRRVGTVSSYIGANTLAAESVTIAPNANVTVTGISSICIGTDAPLQVTLTIGAVSMTIPVNSTLVLDGNYDSVTIANPSAATATANVSLFYTKP
jgi:hypothetical protein